jgi:hypothetical protein
MMSNTLVIVISGTIILVKRGIYLKNTFSLYSGVSYFKCLITFIFSIFNLLEIYQEKELLFDLFLNFIL